MYNIFGLLSSTSDAFSLPGATGSWLVSRPGRGFSGWTYCSVTGEPVCRCCCRVTPTGSIYCFSGRQPGYQVLPKNLPFLAWLSSKYNNNDDEKVWQIARNFQNVTQRRKVNKLFWENGANRLARCRVATNIQFFKNAVSVKWNKAKCNRKGMLVHRDG